MLGWSGRASKHEKGAARNGVARAIAFPNRSLGTRRGTSSFTVTRFASIEEVHRLSDRCGRIRGENVHERRRGRQNGAQLFSRQDEWAQLQLESHFPFASVHLP